ncbi:phage tail tube protein [Rhodopseudomonas palustris]|uniref:phage tail tube protein n=1 Tax=Rhodopseudomonas palustris TaxID=1076 RepID=UPI000D1997B8|nr:phage tail tube protein [Rhodopseudomonas palustris]AVT83665.1 hypothetical protein RPYSC3_48050 [Rhodopseudomonas palustris]
MKGIGRQVQVGAAKETTRGTAQSSATYWLPWAELDLAEKKEFVEDGQAYGVIEDNAGMSSVKRMMEGPLKGPVFDQSIGLLMRSQTGGYTVGAHAGEASVYDHDFTIGQNVQHQSLTFFLHDPLSGIDYSHANGVIGKTEWTFALKKYIEFSSNVKALTGAVKSAFTPATTSENKFLPQHFYAKFALDYAGLGGTKTATGTCSSTTHVTGLSINTNTLRVGMTVTGANIPAGATIATIVSSNAFDLSVASTGAASSYTFGPATISLKSAKITEGGEVEDQEVLGSQDPADFLKKEYSVEGSFEAIWQNESDFKTQFMAGTPLAVRLGAKNTDVIIGTSTNPEIYFDMPKCTIKELGRPFKVKDLVYQDIKFKASYSPSDSMMVKRRLTNTVATYA